MNFVKLTIPDGTPAWIKCDDITRIEAPTEEFIAGNCLITSGSGRRFTVKETPDVVLKKIGANVM